MRVFLTGPASVQASRIARRIPTLLPYGTLAVWFWTCAATPGAAQQIRGTVLQANDTAPIANAAVAVIDDRGSQILQVPTDSSGRFSSKLQRPGAYSLRVEKIGYRTLHTDTFEIGTSEVLELRILVGIEAIPLTPLEVTAWYRDSRAHPDFLRRVDWGRKTGFGRFFTRQDIERTAFLRTSSMLMQVPSIRLVHDRNGSVSLGVSERDALNCRSAVYLNGMEVHGSFGLDDLSLDQLEGVEIYRWRSEMPLDLAPSDVCTAAAFWTRVGTPNPRRGWRSILAPGTVALAGIVLFRLFR
jgi:hypothetical protein